MKVICHIDDVDSSDMILLGRAMAYLQKEKPEGMGALTYYGSDIIISYIKNKSSYSIWVRYDESRTN